MNIAVTTQKYLSKDKWKTWPRSLRTC